MLERKLKGKDLTQRCLGTEFEIKASVIIYNTELILAKKEYYNNVAYLLITWHRVTSTNRS